MDVCVLSIMQQAVADDAELGPELRRQGSRHGADYDALRAKGIPRYMLRLAWICCDADPDRAMQFVRNNFDQPLAFWGVDATAEPSDPVGEAAAGGASPDAASRNDDGAGAGDDDCDDQSLERARTDSHVELRRTTSGDLRALHARARAQALARLSPATPAPSGEGPDGSHLRPRKAQPSFDLLTEVLGGNAGSPTSRDGQPLSELSVGDYVDVNLSELVNHYTHLLDTKEVVDKAGSARRGGNTRKKSPKPKSCRHGATCRRYDCHFSHPAERTPLCPRGVSCQETDKKHRRSYLHPKKEKEEKAGESTEP